VYRSQGNIWSFLLNLATWSFCIFLKRNLVYFYPHRFSQITHLSFMYLTKAVLICRNSQPYLPCIYCPIKIGSEERNVILLDQRLWKLKTCQLLLAYCLLEGPWAIIFFLFSLFKVDTEVPLILLPDTCPFFCEVVEHLLLFISSNYSYFYVAHASNAIILWKSESF